MNVRTWLYAIGALAAAGLLAPGAAICQEKQEANPQMVELIEVEEVIGLEDMQRDDNGDGDGAVLEVNGGQFVIVNGQLIPAGAAMAGKRKLLPFDPAGPHVVEFTDGSTLHGTLGAVTQSEVTIQRSDASARLAFPSSAVARVILDNETDRDQSPPTATIHFASGDWMTGEVLLLRDGKAELRLPSGRRMSLDSRAIDWIAFSPHGAPDVFAGPDSLDGWTSNGGWTCENGVLKCTQMGNVGRNFRVLPDKIDLQFDMDKGEVQRNFMVSMNFTANGGASSRNAAGRNAWAQVRFNESQLYLYCANGNKNVNHSTELSSRANRPAADGKVHYRILFDRSGQGRMVVLINGKKVADQKVPAMPDAAWSGTLNFQPMRWSSDADWKISNIRLQAWDGLLPQADGRTVPDRMDALVLTSGEVRMGRLGALLGAVVSFRSSAGEETIPRDQVRMLRLRQPSSGESPPPPPSGQQPQEGAAPPAVAPAAPQPQPKPDVQEPNRNAGGPRVVLTQRGEWKLSALKLNEGNFTLTTAFGGDVVLPAKELFSIIFPHAAPAKPEPSDRLIFRNGDQLRGTILSFEKDKPLRWQFSPEVIVEFQTRRVGGVLLKSRAEQKQASAFDMVASFRNGDYLGGKLLGVDAGALTFAPVFGGDFRAERKRLASLYMAQGSRNSFWTGSFDADGWWKGQMGPNSGWFGYSYGQAVNVPRPKIYLDGAFSLPAMGSQTGIGRVFEELPDRVEISFDVSSEQAVQGFNAQLFYEKKGSSGLMLNHWQGGMYIYDMQPSRRRGMFGQPMQISFGDKIDIQGRRHRYRILADRKNYKAYFLVDGLQVAQFSRKRENEEDKWGCGISLHPQGGGQYVTFSHLTIAPWNGRAPDAPLPDAAAAETVSLANGDEATATLTSATPDKFLMSFEGEPLELPRDRVLMIDFAKSGEAPDAPPPPAAPEAADPDPRLHLAGGGRLSVQSLQIVDGKIQCSTANLGDLTLPLDAFTEIVWHGLVDEIPLAQPVDPKKRRNKAPAPEKEK